MIKQTIQPSDEKMWSDVESNTQVVSDDDALMKSTGKVGELKRYDYPVRFGRSQLTTSGCITSGRVSLLFAH
jgi:hypothetical protein